MEEPEPLYLDVPGVAERIGVKPDSVREYARRGDMPNPDLVWLGVRLWLVDTIDEWRAHKSVRRYKRPVQIRPVVIQPVRPPKVIGRRGARAPSGGQDKRASRRSSSVGASETPATSTVGEQVAGEVAAVLRSEGHFVTTADVMVLADANTDELEHERQVLQQRVQQKLKGKR